MNKKFLKAKEAKQPKVYEKEYAVRLNAEDGKQYYLQVDSDGIPRIVKTKKAATKLKHLGVMELISNHFWANYWEKFEEEYKLDHRDIAVIRTEV